MSLLKVTNAQNFAEISELHTGELQCRKARDLLSATGPGDQSSPRNGMTVTRISPRRKFGSK